MRNPAHAPVDLDRKFDVIGVLDVVRGKAVHARAGQREKYQSIRRVGEWTVPDGNPVEVARAYVDGLGIQTLYLADLDAIRGEPPQHEVVSLLSDVGRPLIVDGGVGSVGAARRLLESGASHVVVGLETLPSFAVLDEVTEALGGDRVAFSIDLREGNPIFSPSFLKLEAARTPIQIAERAARAGVGMVLLIDLSRVGMGTGLDLDLIAGIRAALPGCRLIPGGGIRSRDDLATLSGAGCDGALVATALVSGRWIASSK